MYTEDDKYKKPKIKVTKSENIGNKSLFINNRKNKEIEEDYYKDYYDDNLDNQPNILNEPFKNIRTLEDSDNLSKKRSVVVIIILFIVLCILIVFLIQTINVKAPPLGITTNYVRLRNEELELHPGDTKKLELILIESKDSNYRIEWFSNDDNVVSVDNNGNIIAINKGEAIILVAYYVNNKIYDAQCRINVS